MYVVCTYYQISGVYHHYNIKQTLQADSVPTLGGPPPQPMSTRRRRRLSTVGSTARPIAECSGSRWTSASDGVPGT